MSHAAIPRGTAGAALVALSIPQRSVFLDSQFPGLAKIPTVISGRKASVLKEIWGFTAHMSILKALTSPAVRNTHDSACLTLINRMLLVCLMSHFDIPQDKLYVSVPSGHMAEEQPQWAS